MENPTLKNFQFSVSGTLKHSLHFATLLRWKLVIASSSMIATKVCTARETAVRDQTIISTLTDEIGEKAYKVYLRKACQ